MNMLISVFEKFAVKDGQFNSGSKALVKFVMIGTIVMIVLDLGLAAIRYGSFGLQETSFYVTALAMIIVLHLVTRKNAETSLAEMRTSKNILVRVMSWFIFLALLVVVGFAKLVSSLGGEGENHHAEKNVDVTGGFTDGLYDYNKGPIGSSPEDHLGVVHSSRVSDV